MLRRYEERDRPAYADAVGDPEAVRFLNDFSESPAAGAEELRLRGEILVLTIADDATDAYLGTTAVIAKEADTWELAYLVAPAARGRGVATSAVTLLTAWAFEALGAQRVQLRIDPANAPSQRVAERCGYTREGVLRSSFVVRGRRVDSVMYSRLPDD